MRSRLTWSPPRPWGTSAWGPCSAVEVCAQPGPMLSGGGVRATRPDCLPACPPACCPFSRTWPSHCIHQAGISPPQSIRCAAPRALLGCVVMCSPRACVPRDAQRQSGGGEGESRAGQSRAGRAGQGRAGKGWALGRTALTHTAGAAQARPSWGCRALQLLTG